MATKKSEAQKTYTVTGRIQSDILVELKANSLQDAIAEANNLKFESFAAYNGEYSDGESVTLLAIWEND